MPTLGLEGAPLPPQLELPLQIPPKHPRLYHPPLLLRRRKDLHQNPILLEQGKEQLHQVIERDRARHRPLPRAAGAGDSEGGVRPEGEGFVAVFAPHDPAVFVLEPPGLFPVREQHEDGTVAVRRGEGQDLAGLVVSDFPGQGHSFQTSRMAPRTIHGFCAPFRSGPGPTKSVSVCVAPPPGPRTVTFTSYELASLAWTDTKSQPAKREPGGAVSVSPSSALSN